MGFPLILILLSYHLYGDTLPMLLLLSCLLACVLTLRFPWLQRSCVFSICVFSPGFIYALLFVISVTDTDFLSRSVSISLILLAYSVDLLIAVGFHSISLFCPLLCVRCISNCIYGCWLLFV